MAPRVTPFPGTRMMASTRSVVISMGFSTMRCFPARATCTLGSMCVPLGVQMETACTLGSASISSAVANARPPNSAARRRAISGTVSKSPRRASGRRPIAFAWNSLIIPQPIIAMPCLLCHGWCSPMVTTMLGWTFRLAAAIARLGMAEKMQRSQRDRTQSVLVSSSQAQDPA